MPEISRFFGMRTSMRAATVASSTTVAAHSTIRPGRSGTVAAIRPRTRRSWRWR